MCNADSQNQFEDGAAQGDSLSRGRRSNSYNIVDIYEI